MDPEILAREVTLVLATGEMTQTTKEVPVAPARGTSTPRYFRTSIRPVSHVLTNPVKERAVMVLAEREVMDLAAEVKTMDSEILAREVTLVLATGEMTQTTKEVPVAP